MRNFTRIAEPTWPPAAVLRGFLFVLAPSIVQAQLQYSVVSGRVFGLQGTPVRDAQVALLDSLGQAIGVTASDHEGQFRIRNVPPGVYHIRAEAASLRSASQRVVARDGLPAQVDLQLSPQLTETMAVGSGTSGPGGASGTTLAGQAVRLTGSPLRSRALRAAVAAMPGWTSEDNGLMHYRGSDDGLLFVLDGIPVYERLDPQFGIGFDPITLGSVRVLSGYVPPEHGLRSGGVIEVRSRAGSLEKWSGIVEAGVGRHETHGLSMLVQGPLGGSAGLTASGGVERSRRFLDPVSPDNLHNQGFTGGGEAELTWAPGHSVVTLRAGHGRSSFDVPHGEEQQRAGQDQRQRLEQSFATLNWQRAWSSATVSQLALFGRFTEAELLGSPSDTPVFAEAGREQDRLGLLAALTRERGRHRLKAGVEASSIRLDEGLRFFVTDAEGGEDADLSAAALLHDLNRPFEFAGKVRRPIFSAYVQDSWRALDSLTVDVGVRHDRSRLLLAESQWSPRVGMSYRLGRAILRASLNRFFQPPQSEYLLLSSSSAAQALSPFAAGRGAGGADIRSERQTAVEAGCEFWIRGALRTDVSVWHRWIRDQGDPNVFFGTTIVFPNSVARGRARGFDLRLELPRRAGIAGSVTYTLSKVDQFGPVTGGLFLEQDFIDIGPGTKFTPDHDQRHALTGEVSYEDAAGGFWAAVSGRYRTGTPLEVREDALPSLEQRDGADRVDFERRRVKPYAIVDVQAAQRLIGRRSFEMSARAALLNLTGTRYAFNFGNPFSGTHFGAPRSVRLDLRLATR